MSALQMLPYFFKDNEVKGSEVQSTNFLQTFNELRDLNAKLRDMKS
jgi:hypothetical protein